MRKLIIAFAFGALLLPDYGFTLGLGEIEVNSALNQQLDAEIELLAATPEDAEKLIVKLASREEFSRAGLDRPFMLSDLKFATEMKDGKPWITVKTSKPVREPFLNFLLEIDWPKGHLLREYTILLDPPVFMEKAPEETYRPAMSESSSAGQAPVQSGAEAGNFRPAVNATAARPSSSAAPAGQSPSQAVAGTQFRYQTGGYRIKTGDTAWGLAESMRPDQSISIEQMMLAMLRSNPEAFIDENVNGLKRGYILRIPDRDEITSMSQAESLALVRQQNAIWREYQQSLAKGKPASAMETGTGAGTDGDIEQQTGAHLEIVAAGSGTSASDMKDPSEMSVSEMRAELVRAREALESGLVEKEELQARASSLESQVERMKSLLTVEDNEMASLQMHNQEAQSAQTSTGDEAEPMTEQAQATEETGEAATNDQVFADEQTAVESSETEAMSQPADQTVPYDVSESMPQQKGPLASLLGNPVLLAGAGGGLLLVVMLIALIVKRRGANAEPQMAASLAAVTDMVADKDLDTRVSDEEVEKSMAAMKAEADAEESIEDSLAAKSDFDAESTLILPGTEDTVVGHGAEHQTDIEEDVDDVTAEADVYLAYGIYQQAEELLKNAIRENPDRDAYRVKLAETYYASKNADGFVEMADDMHRRNEGAETPAWKKVAAIGKELCPDNELFKDAEVASDLDIEDLVPKSPEPMDFELDEAQQDSNLLPDLDIDSDMSREAEPGELDQTAVLDMTEEADVEEGVEFDLAETEAIRPEEDEEFSLDIEASELDFQNDETPESVEAEAGGVDFDLDIKTEEKSVVEAADAEKPVDEESAIRDDETDDLEFDIGDDEMEMPEQLADTDDDETGLDNKYGTEEVPPAITAEGISVIDEELDEDIDLSMLDDVDEVSTKLDLARAYLDMGDAEGTRSILDEVIAEGNDEQKQEAEELLKQLDS